MTSLNFGHFCVPIVTLLVAWLIFCHRKLLDPQWPWRHLWTTPSIIFLIGLLEWELSFFVNFFSESLSFQNAAVGKKDYEMLFDNTQENFFHKRTSLIWQTYLLWTKTLSPIMVLAKKNIEREKSFLSVVWRR